MSIPFFVQPGTNNPPPGIPLDVLSSAFETCRGSDYRIQRAGSLPYERGEIRRLSTINAFWYGGGFEYADEEICVLGTFDWYRVWAVVEANSDSSGWGCQQSMSVTVADTREEVIQFGMSKKYREDLGL